MPQEEQNEWPSFEAVLRDVAPSDVARRTQTAIAASRRALASVDAARDERRGAEATTRICLEDVRDDEPTENTEPHLESIEPSDVSEDRFPVDLLPAPLPPLELDTSAVRVLLERRGATVDTLDFELEALAPLDSAELEALAPLDSAEPQLGEPDSAEPELDDQPDVASVFDLAFSDSTFQHEPTQEIEVPVFSGTPTEIFDDLGFENELAFDTGPFEQESVEEGPFEEVPSGSVFELDESAITATEGDGPERDASDSDEQAEDDHEELPSEVTVLDTFDSVATADEIEGDLSELFTFDPEFPEASIEEEETAAQQAHPGLLDAEIDDTLDLGVGDLGSDPIEIDPVNIDPFANVVPIRPAPGDSDIDESYWATETPNEPDETQPVDDTKHTGWVGLDQTVKTSEEVDDPWAYMRPSEETSTRNLWARRPKFFGGEERKRRKAERRETATHTAEAQDRPDTEQDIAFDSECPNCGSECQVDLDDPIGRRVHVSCPSCDHMWFTPYIIESKTG